MVMHPETDMTARLLTGIGIGVADITKLKANGFYTVAVCLFVLRDSRALIVL
jgi:hypothetical protein